MALKFLSKTCVTRPLTRSQLLIWTGQRLQPDDPLYNMAIAFTLEGAIDTNVFQQAFQHVVQASEAMRATFEYHAGVVRQRFHEQFLYDVELLDFTHGSVNNLDVDQYLSQRTRQGMDVTRCLFDSALLKLSDERYVWYFNQHHLTTDASSTALIYRAVAQEYQRRIADSGVPEVSFVPYSEFVDYEYDRQSAKSTVRAERYWETRTAGPSRPYSFYSEPARERTGVTRRVPCVLGETRIQRIKTLAESEDCRAMTRDLAQFQVFATSLFAWLYRITGNPTLAVGMPMHNRSLAAHKNTPGLFIELYPLIIEVADEDTFASLYKKVARGVQELMVHSGPGVSSFAINRDAQVVLNYITAEFGPFGDIPASSQWLHADSADRNHLVRVQVENFDGLDKLRVFFDLNESAFPQALQEMPGRHFCSVVDAFAKDPQSNITAASLLDAHSFSELARGAPGLDTETQVFNNVIEAFIGQVRRTPDAVALREGHVTLTYQQLLTEVHEFAALLSAESVGRGDRVAIMLPRSFEAVVAILGTLMTGAAYVPIDTEYPASRQDFILREADVRIAVCESGARSSCEGAVPAGIKLVEVALGRVTSSEFSVDGGPESDRTAYIIFTSGSTGRPKGVDVTHANLSNYIQWACAYYQPDGPRCWPLFSSLAFDLTVTSVFVPLCSGGELVIYPDLKDERDIVVRRVVQDNRVDIMKLTPAHLALLQAMDLSTSRLQSLVVGGEDFRTELARSVSNYFGGRVKLFNEYGPTEGTVACSVHCFDPQTDTSLSVPIGKSITNTRLYILNPRLLLQPPGVVGELYIGGAGVARGYYKNDELTAARFINDPFRPGETLYRTGDLARLRLDQNGDADVLMCLGRVDHQLKISGLRAEPAEIEQALLSHPAISEAVVSLYVPESRTSESEEAFCSRCGISGRHPSAQLDEQSVCRICHIYSEESERASAYFGTPEDLDAIVDVIVAGRETRAQGEPDCMMLLSGGKDSTYALCQVVDLGLKPLVFTLDNGFISEGAKDNMKRVVKHLGLELVVGSTPAMNAIFRDSLNRFSNVCNGCFKTIFTLSLQIARERGIRHIFTGLSRGQIFETRVADLFRQGEFDIQRIDAMIVEARKAYHRADDAVSRLMDVSHFDDDSIFTDIEYVDYYRYSEVSLDDILGYLKNRVPWVRPADTGRSTNCLINEAGIFVHKKERGFHNYSLPYSWDVRLGHKERDAAREELDDNINVDNVKRILEEIDYTPRTNTAQFSQRAILAAYYVAASAIEVDELKERLSMTLPVGLVPSSFIQLDEIPLTPNGKIDRDALPSPSASRSHLAVSYEAPDGQVETALAQAWQKVFGIDRIGVNDNFFELGGDSIINIQIVASVARQGVLLSPQQVFDCPTIRQLAAVVGTASELSAEQGPVVGEVALTPIQQRFFSWQLAAPQRYCQYVVLDIDSAVDVYALQEALRQLVSHHDALRARYSRSDSGWQQYFDDTDAVGNVLGQVDAAALPHEQQADPIAALVDALQNDFNLEQGNLFKAVLLEDAKPRLLLLAHHLVVDAVSWWVLLEDLEDGYRALSGAKPIELPPKSSSMRHWSELNVDFASSAVARTELPMWQEAVAEVTTLTDEAAAEPEHNTGLSAETGSHTFHLDRSTSRALLADVTANWRVQPQDLILTAFIETVLGWTGSSSLTLDVEAHGREQISSDVDVLRTVGWFTSVYPLRVNRRVDSGRDESGLLRVVRDALRNVQLGGISYGSMRYASGNAELAQSLEPAKPVPVLFNYLGLWRKQRQEDALFHFAQPLAASFGADNRRPYALELNAMFFDDQLQVTWAYQADVMAKNTISTLSQEMRKRLRTLIEYCSSHQDTQLTPQDFPNAGIDQSDLDDLMADYGDV